MQSGIDAQIINGIIKGRENEPLIQLLDIKQLLELEFSSMLETASASALPEKQMVMQQSEPEEEDYDQLVSFTVENQEYAFNLIEVEEIVRMPASISKVPRADDHVLGMIDLRGKLLPMVSLRRMFALTEQAINEKNRIVVVSMKPVGGRKSSIGLVVDDVVEVLQVSQQEQGAMPSLFLDRADNNNDIISICRLDDGHRLVAVLSIDALFTHPVIQAAMDAQQGEEDEVIEDNVDEDMETDDTAQLVVFYLGEQEYAVSIDDVQEITRIPDKLDKVPKTANFIEGMVNLRGTVLPVLDMRVRFEMEKIPRNDKQRIIVLSLAGIRTGFIVDSVIEVLRIPQEQIEYSPNLSNDQSRMMGQVINLREFKRMIQVLTAKELLSENERETLGEEVDDQPIEPNYERRKNDR